MPSAGSSSSTAATAAIAAKVEPKIIELDQNRVDLVFEINEGPLTDVGRISVHRQRAVQRQHLARRDPDQGGGLVALLLQRRHLRPGSAGVRPGAAAPVLHGARLRRLPACVSAIAELTPGRRRTSTSPSRVEEGEQYKFGKVELESRLKDLGSRAACASSVETKSGETYNADQIEATVAGADRRGRQAGLRLRRDPAAAQQARRRDADDRHQLRRSTRGRGSTSSGSTSSATCAPSTR